MADQQRKVSLIFETNTNKAKSDINDLISSLQKLQAKPTSLIDPTGIREASKAALELQGHIQKAINVDTGKLDLSRFAASLSTSGKSLEQYRATLTRIGPEGTAAFRSVMSSINNAEVSTVRLTKGMKDFLVTMKNTAKWQISSSIMHGLIGGMQSAYGYAKSLDASLNNIRIVTGQTSDQMARFAVEANRAAQALSTTTTKYTDAALIFYQQGLNDKAVKERTEAVIKMANVTGEVAADVSSYMTAIWNNFDNGSKSLEYYADVITELGAATAASSEEIAGGLEKFAAIANTIGLSYEYATSMITTIIDKTRQSEDIVGTALKTILARIQGLNLGDTLDDGTTLNKYSDALARVGVNIKDASGQIKDMDVILDSLGSKWSTLSKDTQIALAQVVGGVRQYNQVISLMDNWGAFKQNVNLANTSTGSLNEQADIYAEGWEAARDRVQAAAEGIYDALINEDVFIKLDNIFTGLLNGVSGVVKGMGGMVPILGTIGGIITQKFAKEMPVALNNMKQNLMVLSGQANKEALQTQKTNTLMAQDMVSRADDSYEASQFETIRRISSMKEKLIENQHRMNSAQIEEYQALIQNEQAIRNIIDERAKSLALLEQEVQTMKEMLGIETAMNVDESKMEEIVGQEADEAIAEDMKSDRYKALREEKNRLEGLMSAPEEDGTSEAYAQHEIALNKVNGQLEVLENKSIRVFEKYSEYIKRTASEMVDLSAKQGIATKNADNFNKFLKPGNIKSYEGNLQGLKAVLENWNSVSFQSKDSSKYLQEALDALGKEGAEEKDVIDAVTQAVQKMAEAERQAAADAKLLADAKVQELIKGGANKKDVYRLRNQGGQLGPQSEENLENKEPKGPEIKLRGNTEVLTQAAGTLMSTYGALNAVISANSTLMDENATAMEKAGAIVGALTSITFAATGVIGLYNTLKESQIVANIKETGTKLVSAAATTTEGAAYGFLTAMVKKAQVAVGSFMASNPIGWILAIVAAVVALGVAIANIDWRSDEEKKLEALKEKSEALSKAQENLAQQVKDVESAWSNYQDMVSALEECTSGTEAWNQALLNCNQSVLTLLDMAPELAQFVQYGENGQITLGGVGYENYIADLQQKNMRAQAIETIATTDYSIQQLDLYGTDKNVVSALQTSFSQSNLVEALSHLDGGLIESEYDDIITAIFEAFGDNFENAIDFISDAGLVSHRNFAEDMYRVFSGGTVYDSIADYALENRGGTLDSLEGGNVVDPRTLLSQWSQNIGLADSYEAQQRASTHMLLGTQTGYDENYLTLYEGKLRAEIETAMSDASKAYSSADKSALEDLMEQTFGGAEGSYSEMTEQAMRFALATMDVTSSAEALSGIVNEVNDIAIRSTELGKELLSASGDVSKIGINTQVSEMTSNNIPLPSSLVLSEEQNALRELNINSRAALVSEQGQAFTLKGNLATVWEDAINQVNDFIAGYLEEEPNLDDLVIRGQVDKTQLPSYQRVQTAQSSLSAAQEKYDINQMTGELGYAEQQNSLFAAQVAMLESDLESEQEWLATLQEKRSKYDTTDYSKAITDQEAVVAAAIEELGNLDPLYGAMKRSGVSAETLWIEKMAGTDFTTWNLSEEDAALLNNARAKDIQSRTNDAWMMVDETMSAQLDVIAEAQVKLDNLRGLAETSAKNQKEVAKLDEQIAEQEALILDTQTAIELARSSIKDVESQRVALEAAKTEIANAEAELSSAEAALEAEYTEAEAQMQTTYQREKEQAIWDKYIEIYEKAGLIIPESLKTLGEDLSFDEAYAQAYEILETTQTELDGQISTLESDIAALDVEAENITKDIVEIYFEALGLSLEKFLANNSNYTVDSLYTALGDLGANPELALDLQAAQYQNRYGNIFGEDASASDIISRGQELDSREQLYTMLQGENHNLDLNDDVTFNYIRDLYGLVGETAEEVFGYLEAQVITAKNMAAQEWTSSLGDKYAINFNKETGQFEGSGTELSSFQVAQAQNVDTTQINTMGKLLAEVKGLTTEEGFSAFNNLIGTMIESSQDFDKVMTIVDQAREKMVSLGRQLTAEEVEEILADNETSAAALGTTLDELTTSLNGTVSAAMLAASAFDNLTSSLSAIKGNLKGLTKGTILDKDAWGEVKDSIPEGYEDLFLQTAEGGATFIGSEEQGQELYRKALLESGSRYKTAVDGVEATRTAIMGEGNTLSVDGTTVSGSDLSLENIQSWMLSQGGMAYEGSALESVLKALGQENAYQEAVEAGLTTETDEGTQWSEAGNAIANAVLTVLSGNYTNPDEASQVLATSGADRATVEQWNKEGLFANDAHYQYAASEAIVDEYGQVGISSEEIQEQIEYLQEFADVAHLSQSELTELAASQVRFNRGVENGQDNMSDWIKELKNGEKSSKKYQDAQEGIIDTFGDILDLDWDKSAIKEFAESDENLELMEKALEGDTDALADLESQVAQIDLAEALDIETVPNQIASVLDSISDIANSYDFGDIINIDSPDYGPIYAAFNELTAQAVDTGMGVEEAMIHAQNVLAGLDLSVPTPEYEWVTVDVNEKAPDGFVYSVTSAGSATDAMGNPIDLAQVSKVTTVPGPPLDGQISYLVNKGSGGGVKSTNQKVGSGGRRGGGGGGGGGGSRAPRAEKKKDTEKERYHSIKNVLEDLNDNFEKISKARDRAFGKSRVKMMEEEEKALQDLAAAQRLYLDEIEANLVQDRNNLGQLQAYSGVELKFDENGTLLNFEDLQNAMWDKYNAQINGKGEVKNMTEEEWKKWEEEWQRQMDLLEQYEETQDLWKTEMQAYQDYINQIYDLRLEKVTYTVEVDLEASEHDLEFLQYMLDKIGDSAWDTAEAIANLSSQTEEYLGKLDENGEWDENGQVQDIQRGIAGILRNHSEPLPNADKKIGDVLGTDMSEYKEAVKKQQAALAALASGKDKGGTGKKTGSGGGGGGGRNTDEDKKEPDASIPTAPSQTILSEEDIQGFMNGDQAAIDKVIAMGNNGEFTEAEVEALKDYHSKLLETNKSLMELRDTMHEKVLAAFQGFNEELQEGIDKIDHLAQLTQNYRNIVDIVGKENLNVSNTLMEAMGQASVEQGIDRVQASKARRDSLKQMLEDARASRAAATNDKDRERWDENIKQMEADLRDAEEDFMQSWEDALTSIQEQFELAVTNTIETFSDALAGPLAGSLDELQASFDRQNNLAERYLPDYEKIYELNKLNRDITNSIDETDNVKAKQELADLQQEINALEEEGVEVSRYQTEDLRRRYELKLAEIALEEAKNAKSQVQMARDSDGNWSYVYTADEEDVAAAEQNYEDKMFALQQANAQYINEMQNSLIQTQAEMASEIEAIMMDETLSMEEKMQKVNELKEYYAEMFQYYSDELQLVMDNNGTAFEDTTLSALTGFTDLQDYEQNFYDATEAMLTDLGEAYDNWEANTEAAMNAAGTTMDDYADTMAEQTQAIVEESQEAADAVEDLGQRAVDAFDGITDAVENWVTTYGEKVNEILSTNEKLADSFRKVLEEWSDFDGKTEETTPPTDPNDGETEPEPEDEPEEEKKPERLGTVTIKKGYRMNIRTGPGTGHRDIGTVDARKKKKSYTYSKKDGKWVYIDALGGWMNGQYKKYTYLTPFDTGGYTGAWGSEGRVAMLHEKEIVLNKEDTSNLLTAVDMIRQVAKIIDLNAYSSAGFGSSLIGLASGSAGQFEQNVHITAEFPNATNREEIYAAFTDIVNLASQYANR